MLSTFISQIALGVLEGLMVTQVDWRSRTLRGPLFGVVMMQYVIDDWSLDADKLERAAVNYAAPHFFPLPIALIIIRGRKLNSL